MAKYKYSFHEERGEFHGYVEDEMGNTIYEMHYPEYYEDDETGELIESSTIFEDGFMKTQDDTEGLKKYLVSMNLLDEDDEVLTENEFEESYMSGGQTGAYGHGTSLLAKGDIVSETKKELSKNFELPYEIAIYVPSTEKGNVIINKGEFQKRIDEVRTYLADLFGGFSSGEIEGGYVSDKKGLIREDIVRVVCFASKDGFKDKFKQLQDQVKVWCREWGQESMGVEFEGDLFYVSSSSQYADGGDTTEEDLEEEENEENDEQDYLDELSEDLDIPTDVLREYASDRGIDILDLRFGNIQDNYIGSYSSREDFGERMVNEGMVGDLSNYLEMYDSDKETFANDEADSRLDGMDDEDIVQAGDLEGEYNEVKERLERIDELTDEIEEIESRMQELSEQDTETEEDAEEVSNEMSDLDDKLEYNKSELYNLENEENDLDDIVNNAREYARDNIYQEILDELNRDAVGYFTDNLGYDVSDLANHSLFTIDYDSIADDFEPDYLFIEAQDGDLYVFKNYKWGGKLEHGGSVEQGNFRMLLNQAKELKHHAEELEHVLSKRPRVDAWVVALSERASLALSDITHYLDGTIHDDKASDSDVLNINVPTYIRTLEYAREDAKSDVDLHKLTENALEVSDKEGVVEMDDYEEIVPKMASGGEMPSPLSWAKLKVGQVYEWTIGAEPLQVKYLGKTKDNPNKKAGSSIGKGFLFEWVDEPNKYVEVGLTSIPRVLANMGTFARGGVNLGASFEKLKGQMKEEDKGRRTRLVGWDKNNRIFAYAIAKDRGVKKDGTFEEFKESYFKEIPNKEYHYNDNVLRYAYEELNKEKFAKGGDITEEHMEQFDEDEGVDLFEDYDDIPANLQKVLDKNQEALEGGDYRDLEKILKQVNKLGYTFEYDLDGVPYDLRKIGQKGKSESYANGGALNKDSHSIGGFIAGAVAGGVGTYLYQKNKNKSTTSERNKSDWREDLKSDIDKEGFDYAMTQLVDEDEINDAFKKLRNNYLSALKKVNNLDGLKKEDREELESYYDSDGIDYTLVEKGVWRGIKNTKFQANRKEYIKSRDAIKKYLGLDKNYAKGGVLSDVDMYVKIHGHYPKEVMALRGDGMGLGIVKNEAHNFELSGEDSRIAEEMGYEFDYYDAKGWVEKEEDDDFAKGGNTKWIQEAISKKGALRETAKRKGLIEGDEKLSMTDLKKLEKVGGKTGQRARLAETLRGLGNKKEMAEGGESTFQEKVTKIAKKNVGKAVPKSVQKDYGKRFSKNEALDSARRIVGSMKAKGYFK